MSSFIGNILKIIHSVVDRAYIKVDRIIYVGWYNLSLTMEWNKPRVMPLNIPYIIPEKLLYKGC